LFAIVSLITLSGCLAADPPLATTTLSPSATPADPPAFGTPLLRATAIPSPTPTASLTPSATPLPGRITDGFGAVMVLIPAGEFIMGSEQGFSDERPVHTVYVASFYIDLLEVTNREYRACVDAGVCHPPARLDSATRADYFTNPQYDAYPVIWISWYDAFAYCAWRGARLPTEAEWEKAARGADGRTYPWGDQEPIPDLLNFIHSGIYDTAPVGSYPLGASPYGVLDMAGNVYEWVQDIYAPDYYHYSPYTNPTGPEEGTYRVTRGGSWYNQAFRNRSANRNNAFIPADSVHNDGGARCALDAPPP
jgi:serine/threonine-protein kinase